MPLRPCSCDACFDIDLASSVHGLAFNCLLMVPKYCLLDVGAETLLGPSELERGMQSLRSVWRRCVSSCACFCVSCCISTMLCIRFNTLLPTFTLASPRLSSVLSACTARGFSILQAFRDFMICILDARDECAYRTLGQQQQQAWLLSLKGLKKTLQMVLEQKNIPLLW